MVGLGDIWFAYQNSGPLLLFVMIVGGALVYRRDIQPRLQNLEETQEQRASRWQDHELNAQERALLLDDAHERIDGVEEAVDRLRERLLEVQHAVAAEHGRNDATGVHDDTPNGGD
jgi:uncharacterized protein HemX